METVQLKTDAGHSITARIFTPEQPQAIKAAVIIATATGVAQYLYDDFANWLAEQGYAAITFDYDGIGLSIDGHVKNSQASMLRWAQYDCPAVIKLAQKQFPQQKIIWLGHSVGAHVLGMMEDVSAIDKVVTVAAGTGYWWHNSPPTKRVAWLLWYFIVPVTVPLFGYFPGSKINIMCDLPKGVIWQWRKWCLYQEYCVGVEGDWLRQRFANVKLPIYSISFSDDEMMSQKNIKALHDFYSSADKTMVLVSPKDIGEKRIGHIGWHKKRYRQLWQDYLLPAIES